LIIDQTIIKFFIM